MRTGLFTGHFANRRYAISIITTYYIKIKNVFVALEIAERPFGKFQGKNQSQIFDQIVSVVLRWAKPKNHQAKISHKKYQWFCGERNQNTTEPKFLHKKYRWFCGERNETTTEPKFSIKSIGGFAMSHTEKPPQRENSIGSFTVNKTDKRLKKFYRWFFGDFDWQLKYVILSVVTGSLMEKENIGGF